MRKLHRSSRVTNCFASGFRQLRGLQARRELPLLARDREVTANRRFVTRLLEEWRFARIAKLHLDRLHGERHDRQVVRRPINDQVQ